jgi:NAD-dependent DNA ligase
MPPPPAAAAAADALPALIQQTTELVDRLKSYCEAYYNSAQPLVSDAEYDAALGLFRQLLQRLRGMGQQGRDEARLLEERSPLRRVVSTRVEPLSSVIIIVTVLCTRGAH